jgi:hypothetical protein
MTRKDANGLLLHVLREMRFQDDETKRYDLQVIGESLVSEYRDLNAKEIDARIVKIGTRT